jgi:hypothetical protein
MRMESPCTTVHLVGKFFSQNEIRKLAVYLFGRRVWIASFEPADGKRFDGFIQVVDHSEFLPLNFGDRLLNLEISLV